MKPVLLIDFGSTYTKVTAVDVDSEEVLGTSCSYTTIETDINDGLSHALLLLEQQTGKLEFVEKYACSSAAGGLKIVAVGLVPDLTAKAARMASLGAGGKVLKVYSYKLTNEDIKEIEELKPEIILLCGGTDGGNTDNILYNAEMISNLSVSAQVIIAGNRNCASDCQKILEGKKVSYVCENVMPTLDKLNIEPTQQLIRDIFLKRIIEAKGLSKAKDLISGIVNPTPAAVLKAINLLANGYEDETGIGDLLAIDVGGATTDIYTVSDYRPTKPNVVYRGLEEPYLKRTVEGDIGMRYSVKGILNASGLKKLSKLANMEPSDTENMVNFISEQTSSLPRNELFRNLDKALAMIAVETAVTRHAGSVSEVYTMMGPTFVQTGKDLSDVKQIVVTGGSLIHSDKADEIASCALCSKETLNSLKPTEATVLVDRKYIIASMGLLSEHYPECALHILKKELENLGIVKENAIDRSLYGN